VKYRQHRSSTAMTASVRTCAGGIEAGRAPSAMVVAPQPMMNGSRCTRRRTQWSADFSGSGSAASPAMLATVIAARRGGPTFQSRFAGARVPSLSAQIGPLMPGPGENRADADIVLHCHIRVTELCAGSVGEELFLADRPGMQPTTGSRSARSRH
jgi:hypothetical protein